MNRTPEMTPTDNNILLMQAPDIIDVVLEERGSGLSKTVGAAVVVAGGALGGALLTVTSEKPASAERVCNVYDPWTRVVLSETYNDDGSLDQTIETYYCDDLPTTTAPPPDTIPTTAAPPPTTPRPATTATPTTQKPAPTTPAPQKSTTTVEQQTTTTAEEPVLDPNGDPDADNLKTKDELIIGTDPENADSNNNGTPDGQEDADGGGTSNETEVNVDDTDPTDASDDIAKQEDEVEVLGTATVNTSETTEAPTSTAPETTIATDQSGTSETTDSYVDSTNSGIDGTTAVVGGVSGVLVIGALLAVFKRRKRNDEESQKPVQ